MDGIVDAIQATSTENNWGARLKDRFAGIGIGLLLFFGSFPLLFLNEGRAVDRYETLDEGAAQTISISATSIDPANDGKLVHLTTVITGGGSSLTDPIFGVSTKDLFLDRQVSMYQWHETQSTRTRTNAEGKEETITTYSYRKDWSTRLVNSNFFQERTNHKNPPSFPFDNRRLRQNSIFAGKFELPEEVISKINWFSALSYEWDVTEIPNQDVRDRSEILRNGRQGGYYVGYFTPALFTSTQQTSPTVGDTRITFSSAGPRTVSLIAKQQGGSLQRWEAEESNGSILLFSQGEKSIDQLFAEAEARNAATTWALRILGFVLMGVGMCLILEPIVILADAIPVLGDIVRYGITAIAFIIAGFFAGLTISIAWLFHRPLIGGIILLVITVITGAAFYNVKSNSASSDSDNNGGGEKEDEEAGLDEESPAQEEEYDETYDENEEEEIVVKIDKGVAVKNDNDKEKTVKEVPF